MSLTSSRLASEPISAAEIDQLIGAVAARHGFLLDRRDPVLATVTLHELMIERLLVRIDKAAEAARLEIGAGAHQHTEAAKTAASHLITRAAEYADEQFRLAARAAADEIRSGVLKQLSDNTLVIDAERVASAASTARWSMTLAVLAASATALIAIVFPLIFGSVSPSDECKLPARQAVAHEK
jgi:isopentenyl phosphate kinase